jgi:hypothetical protein
MYLQYLIQFASLGLDEDDTLLRVIYERSSTEFSNYIINSEPQKMISSLEEETHITPLTVWNSSLQLIVSSGLINSTSVLTRGTLEKALELGEIEAIEILLQFGCQVAIEDWFAIFRIWNQHYHLESAYEIKRRANVLHALAERLAHSNTSLSKPSERNSCSDDGTLLEEVPLYHTDDVSVLAAGSAWAAGCRDLNSIHRLNGFMQTDFPHAYGTPLWVHSSTHW